MENIGLETMKNEIKNRYLSSLTDEEKIEFADKLANANGDLLKLVLSARNQDEMISLAACWTNANGMKGDIKSDFNELIGIEQRVILRYLIGSDNKKYLNIPIKNETIGLIFNTNNINSYNERFFILVSGGFTRSPKTPEFLSTIIEFYNGDYEKIREFFIYDVDVELEGNFDAFLKKYKLAEDNSNKETAIFSTERSDKELVSTISNRFYKLGINVSYNEKENRIFLTKSKVKDSMYENFGIILNK